MKSEIILEALDGCMVSITGDNYLIILGILALGCFSIFI
jgi:hypothetical protein